MPTFSRHTKNDTNALVYGKVPPQNLDAEKAVLGVILLESGTIEEVATILRTADCFYSQQHQLVYSAALKLHKEGSAVDLLTVTNELQRNGNIDLAGGPFAITELTLDVVSGAHVQHHARIIMQHYLYRQVIAIGGKIVQEGYNAEKDVFDLIASSDKELQNLTAQIASNEPLSASDVSLDTQIAIGEERMSETVPGGYMGLGCLREKMDNWKKTDLITLAGRPGTGKTALAIQIMLDAASYQPSPTPCLFLSMEMPNTQLMRRIQSNISGVEVGHLTSPKKMSNEEYHLYTEAHKKIKSLPFFLLDRPALSITDIKSIARKMKKKHNIGMLIIDYLQLMSGSGNNYKRLEDIVESTRKLKELAKEEDLTIIMLSQLNREVEKRQGGRPKLSDLKESGSIEEDSDIIIMLSLPTKEDLDKKPEMKGHVIVDVLKYRAGEPFLTTAYFNRNLQKWSDGKQMHDLQPNDLKHPNSDHKTMQKASTVNNNRSDNGDDLPF